MSSYTYTDINKENGFEKENKKNQGGEPAYIANFRNALTVKESTKEAYVKDLYSFLLYLSRVIPQFDGLEVSEIPLEVFTLLSRDDIEKYITFLKEARFLSAASIYAKVAVIKAFYSYLFDIQYTFNNPCKNIKLSPGRKNPSAVLSSAQINALFTGMLQNNLFLIDSSGDDVRTVSISEIARVRREPLIYRNLSIFHLFLFCGLSLEELESLNINDVSFKSNSIIIRKNSKEHETISFSDDTAAVLAKYINGITLPSSLTEKFLKPGNTVIDWCRQSKHNIYFEKKLLSKFPAETEEFYHDVRKLASSMRMQGRAELSPKKGEKALFVSSRGKRMSRIMIQKMIKEMLQTYLHLEGNSLSSTLLRRTCAANIVSSGKNVKDTATRLAKKNVKGICKTLRE